MISHRFPLLLLLLVSLSLNAQDYPKQIQLHPDVGDTLNLLERNFFDLYPKVEGFQFATFEMQSETILGSTIYFLESGELKNQVVSQPNSELKRMRYLIDQNREKYDSPYEVKIVRTNGENLDAELMMYDTTGIYFYSEIIPEVTEEMNYFKLPYLKIDSIIVNESGGISPVWWGAGIGAVIGALVAIVDWEESDKDNWRIYSKSESIGLGALVFGVAGFVVGLVVEIIDSNTEESVSKERIIVPNNSDYINNLKKFVMYNFGNDQKLISKYKLLDW